MGSLTSISGYSPDFCQVASAIRTHLKYTSVEKAYTIMITARAETMIRPPLHKLLYTSFILLVINYLFFGNYLRGGAVGRVGLRVGRRGGVGRGATK